MSSPQTWRYAALLPFSWLYAGIIRLRNWGYESGLFKTVRTTATTISIGNLSVGGTGKTPMVAWLANALVQRHFRVAIVARGYHREGKNACIVSDGRGTLADLKHAGDEPLLLAEKCPHVPIVIHRSKTAAAQIAEQKFQSQIILVDDGFQHRRLQRDCDLILMPAHLLSPPAWLLPAGPLREPWSSLRRAHAVGLTGASHKPGDEQKRLIAGIRRHSQAPLILIDFIADGLEHLAGERRLAKEQLQQAKVFLVSGIANPWRFREMTTGLQARLVGELSYRDHYRFTGKDAEKIVSQFHATGADFIITTAKDGIKLRQFENLRRLPCFILDIRIKAAPADLAALLSLVEQVHFQRSDPAARFAV